MPLTVGTAGHIDHGKTWLVRALTGKDTDRLPEEQARGISIDLGYAPLELPDGRRLSLVDVPGHERFVRTMIAGATGIDLFLLVIDAQEGARPQTLEHLSVLRLLGVEHGVVAVTKADAVDDETLELAIAEAQELVPGAEVVAVSAKTGAGLDELRAALARVPVRERDADGATRLYVDRVFTLQGSRHDRDRDALVGLDRSGRHAARRAVGPQRARALGAGSRRGRRARRGRAARRGQPGADRTHRARARRRARRARPLSVVVPARRAARPSSQRSRRQSPSTLARSPSRRESRATATTRSFASSGASSRREATASCCAPTRRSAAVSFVDPAPPRGLDSRRLEAIERGE